MLRFNFDRDIQELRSIIPYEYPIRQYQGVTEVLCPSDKDDELSDAIVEELDVSVTYFTE